MVNGKWVLVVEDDADAAEVIQLIVESPGRACAIAHTGRDAIHIARELCPEIVLLDVALPDLSGYEIARALRAGPDGASIYIVALTGYADAHHRQLAFAAGFDGYIVKPITVATIAQVLRDADAADRRSNPSSPRVALASSWRRR